jgi:hypothetical protein
VLDPVSADDETSVLGIVLIDSDCENPGLDVEDDRPGEPEPSCVVGENVALLISVLDEGGTCGIVVAVLMDVIIELFINVTDGPRVEVFWIAMLGDVLLTGLLLEEVRVEDVGRALLEEDPPDVEITLTVVGCEEGPLAVLGLTGVAEELFGRLLSERADEVEGAGTELSCVDGPEADKLEEGSLTPTVGEGAVDDKAGRLLLELITTALVGIWLAEVCPVVDSEEEIMLLLIGALLPTILLLAETPPVELGSMGLRLLLVADGSLVGTTVAGVPIEV